MKIYLTIIVVVMLTMACGGSSNYQEPIVTETKVSNVMTITYDEYGLKTPTFFYSTNSISVDNKVLWSIQSAIAENINDPNWLCVIRIDIDDVSNIPSLDGQTFTIHESSNKFIGKFIVFNESWLKSVKKKVEYGFLTFDSGSDSSNIVSGNFDVVMTDYDSDLVPSPKYRIAGTFTYDMNNK